jgi:hypothetical protein
MADENKVDVVADATAPKDVAPAEKKKRQPRRAKAATEAATVVADVADAAKPAKKTRAKRGSKTDAAKAPAVSTRKRVAKAVAASPATNVGAKASNHIDDFADLIKLEEENKRLRKQLSEKLRAENADLRKRLGQN